MCTYNHLAKAEPSVSKHVEDNVESISLTKVHFVGLYYTKVCMLKALKYRRLFKTTYSPNCKVFLIGCKRVYRISLRCFWFETSRLFISGQGSHVYKLRRLSLVNYDLIG
jgi:hypothetical protein